MRIIFSSFIFFSYFLIFRIFHLISSFAPHLIATSSSSCSSRVLYLAECWTFCFLEVDGSVLKTLFHWFDHHFSVMRICVWGVRLDHSFQYWLISAVGQCGGWAGARGRWHFAKVIQTLYKLVMIVRLAVQTKGLFTPSLGRAGGRAGWHLRRRRCGRALAARHRCQPRAFTAP